MRPTPAGERIGHQLALTPVWPGDEMMEALLEAAWEEQGRGRLPRGSLRVSSHIELVLGGEPLPARPDMLCASCNAGKGLGQRRR